MGSLTHGSSNVFKRDSASHAVYQHSGDGRKGEYLLGSHVAYPSFADSGVELIGDTAKECSETFSLPSPKEMADALSPTRIESDSIPVEESETSAPVQRPPAPPDPTLPLPWAGLEDDKHVALLVAAFLALP